MIDKLLRAMSHERVPYKLFAIARLIFEQIAGRLHGLMLCWMGSYLGSGSRVIGSRHISVAGGAYINRNAWIEAVHTYRGQQFEPIIKIGFGFAASDRLHISCINRIEIGDNCLLGSNIYIGDHNHGNYKGFDHSSPTQPPRDRKLVSNGKVIIGSNVWIGDNVVIVGSLTIGDGVVIGANSTVTSDITSNVLVGGNPAKVLKIYDPFTQKWERQD